MTSISIIHKGNGDTEAHLTGCRDIARKLRTSEYVPGTFVLEAETTRDVWLEYNRDFLEEGGAESAWDVNFKPCCGLIVDNDRSYIN